MTRAPIAPRALAAALVGLAVVAVAVLAASWLRGASRPILRFDPQFLLTAATPRARPDRAGSPSRQAVRPAAVVVDPAWIDRTAGLAGIPEPAMRAYATAAVRVDADDSACALGWTTLAGIGYVESQNGEIGGRAIKADGHSAPPIVGPALNGTGQLAAIRATPQSTQWHGDHTWAHAVGPMQFIPSSWEVWGADGDGDGVADPNDIDDAAYATARYLCADGGDLRGAGWGQAIFSYNHSDAYVREVYDAASAYATRTSG